MLKLGILNKEQYARAAKRQKLPGSGVSYNLLDVGDDAGEEEIRIFEDVSFSLRMSNGTTRMTFRDRFRDVNKATLRIMKRLYAGDARLRVQDRAVSHGLTSCEWAEELFEAFPNAGFEASDTLLYLFRISVSKGETYIVEPNGEPLQYINPPFVVSISHREPLRFPINHLVSARARRRFKRLGLPEKWRETGIANGYKIDKISCIHPRARLLVKREPRFRICVRSIFEHTPGIDVLRTMNILNKAYFRREKLIEGAMTAFCSLKPGGLWIVGRTLEDDSSNHVTFLLRNNEGWEVLDKLGTGSEMEEFAALAPAILQAAR